MSDQSTLYFFIVIWYNLIYQDIEVDYLDQNFKKQHRKYSGWTAQIIQHEIDHCNGVVI